MKQSLVKRSIDYRARVRIVGYHSPEPDLPDKDLPLAHVLLPANMSVTGGQGESMMLQGGETVIGFFADGEDGQQPVVFGTLFKQVADQLSSNQFYSTGQTEFIPYTPPDVRQNMGLHTINPELRRYETVKVILDLERVH